MQQLRILSLSRRGGPEERRSFIDRARFTGKDRHQAEKSVYEQVPVAMTIVRDGSQLGSCGCNKCVGCPVMSDLCADNFVLVAGKTVEEDKKEIGKTLIDRLPSTIGGAKVPYSCLNKCIFTYSERTRFMDHPVCIT